MSDRMAEVNILRDELKIAGERIRELEAQHADHVIYTQQLQQKYDSLYKSAHGEIVALKTQLAAPKTKLSFEEWHELMFPGRTLAKKDRACGWNAALENLDLTQIKWPVVKAEDVKDDYWYIFQQGTQPPLFSKVIGNKSNWWIGHREVVIYGPIPMPTKGVECDH